MGIRRQLLESGAWCAGLAMLALSPVALAQDAANAPTVDEQAEIVVTGTRIRAQETPAPTMRLDAEVFGERGYVNAAQAINQLTSSVPTLIVGRNDGQSSGSGQQYPNLFGLGAGRTLTLVNGRRFVTSSNGLEESRVDAALMPTGLIQSIDVVQAGGAVVYGSDAIAGVVNYVLKKDFSGVELDAQSGISSRGDYPEYSLRGTFGTNFGGGRGNVALNVEWSRTEPLTAASRPISNISFITASNPLNTGPADGIPSIMQITDARFTTFNTNGVIMTIPAPVPLPPCGNQICFARNAAGQPLQFSPDGSVISYNPGTILAVPFSTGGDGFRFGDLAGLVTGVERFSANLIGHYDLTDAITVSTELTFARTTGTEFVPLKSRTILNNDASGAGVITFFRTNPFLSPASLAALTAASPGFGAGAPLFLSKTFPDLLQDNRRRSRADTYRGLIALEGELGAAPGDLYWSAHASFGEVRGSVRAWGIDNAKVNRALNAVSGPNGPVCAVNADAIATNDDTACVAINPFGAGNVSQAARDYVNVPIGLDYVNRQVDLFASLAGKIAQLPGGPLSFSAAFEHRAERARFTPLAANQLGLTGTGGRELPQAGHYDTDELSAELLVPIVGGDFTLPAIESLSLTGAVRYVDNSLAGKETLWSVGGEWRVDRNLMLRASRSRNFRAPSLGQLLAPATQALGAILADPCDADNIGKGPNPAIRRANCLALFQANTGYGVLADGSNASASAESRLAVFQDPAENFSRATITTGGNPLLRNEISDTLTYGFVLTPSFIPGLRFTADRVEIDLKDGLSAFTTQDFAAACYDNETAPTGVCGAFSRLAGPNGTDPGGTILTGTTTTFNAGVVRYRGEVFALNYRFDLASLFGASAPGRITIDAEATHTSLLTTSVTGQAFVRTDNTVKQPDWSGRLTLGYAVGDFRLSYQLQYLSRVLSAADATIENDPYPVIDSNMIHSLSAQIEIGQLELRAGVVNMFDKGPSYPVFSYGDILGRRFFAGAKLRF
jgi:outer membrane receptor protein involved in Fe transport